MLSPEACGRHSGRAGRDRRSGALVRHLLLPALAGIEGRRRGRTEMPDAPVLCLLAKDAVVPENLPRLLAFTIIRKREIFLRASWRHTLVALGRSLLKTSPNRGPLTSQQDARAWLAARPARKPAAAPPTEAGRSA